MQCVSETTVFLPGGDAYMHLSSILMHVFLASIWRTSYWLICAGYLEVTLETASFVPAMVLMLPQTRQHQLSAGTQLSLLCSLQAGQTPSLCQQSDLVVLYCRRNPFMTSNATPRGAFSDGYAAQDQGVLGSALSGILLTHAVADAFPLQQYWPPAASKA